MRGYNVEIRIQIPHHRPFKLRSAGVPLMAQYWWLGSFVIFSWSILQRNTIFVCDFSGGGGVRTPCPPSESAHGYTIYTAKIFKGAPDSSQEVVMLIPGQKGKPFTSLENATEGQYILLCFP